MAQKTSHFKVLVYWPCTCPLQVCTPNPTTPVYWPCAYSPVYWPGRARAPHVYWPCACSLQVYVPTFVRKNIGVNNISNIVRYMYEKLPHTNRPCGFRCRCCATCGRRSTKTSHSVCGTRSRSLIQYFLCLGASELKVRV